MSDLSSYDFVCEQIVGRYRVEKTSQGFWPYCVRAGDGTQELYLGHKKSCERVAAALQTACLDGAFMASTVAPAMEEAPVVVPKGFKLVPTEPTLRMVVAGFDAAEARDGFVGFKDGLEARRAIYAAMLAAAPSTGDL